MEQSQLQAIVGDLFLALSPQSIVQRFKTRPVVIDQTFQKKYSRPHDGQQPGQWLIIHKCRHMEPTVTTPTLIGPPIKFGPRDGVFGLNSPPCLLSIVLTQNIACYVTEGNVHKPHVTALVLRAHEQPHACLYNLPTQMGEYSQYFRKSENI